MADPGQSLCPPRPRSLTKSLSEALLPKNLSEACLKALDQAKSTLKAVPRNFSQTCLTGGAQINYDTFGLRGNPAVLLIMGMASQKVRYPTNFCSRLADAGYFVVRFDNRDCGSSSRHVSSLIERITCLIGMPALVLRRAFRERWLQFLAVFLILGKLAWRTKQRRYKSLHAAVGLWMLGLMCAPEGLPYSCKDMARDCARLLEKLGVAKAHLVGFSMGGMIAQTFALEHRRRVLSLVLVGTCHQGAKMVTSNLPWMTMHALTSGNAWDPRADSAARQSGLERFWSNIAAPESREDPDRVERQQSLAAEEMARGKMDIDAYLRQVMAVMRFVDGAPKRPEALPPTLVIHGAEDPLIPVFNGVELAKLMRCQRCVILPNVGHDILTAAEDEVLAAVVAHLAEVRASRIPSKELKTLAGAIQKPEAIQGNWDAIKKCPSMTVLAMDEPEKL